MKCLIDNRPRSRHKRHIGSIELGYIRADRTYHCMDYRRYRSISTVSIGTETKPQSKYTTLRSPASISGNSFRLRQYRHISTIDDNYALRSLDHPDHNISTLKRHIW